MQTRIAAPRKKVTFTRQGPQRPKTRNPRRKNPRSFEKAGVVRNIEKDDTDSDFSETGESYKSTDSSDLEDLFEPVVVKIKKPK